MRAGVRHRSQGIWVLPVRLWAEFRGAARAGVLLPQPDPTQPVVLTFVSSPAGSLEGPSCPESVFKGTHDPIKKKGDCPQKLNSDTVSEIQPQSWPGSSAG